MKTAKRILSVGLTLLMLLGVFPAEVFAAEAAVSYTDVKAGDWFYDDVVWAMENGIMDSVSAKEFQPSAPADRATLVSALYRLEKKPYILWKNYFTDITGEEDYAPAVEWASGNGIVKGYTDGTFRPDTAITREQLAALIYRYVQYRGGGFTGAWAFPLKFEDASSVSDWAYESLCWCTMKQIVTGTSETTISPKGGATRCQLAAMLRRLTETHEQTLTRADLEAATMASAWAYYFKFEKMQYDSISISDVPKYDGGAYRGTENVAPEYGTDDTVVYSVCSDYANKSWYNGTGIRTLGEPLDAMTISMWHEGEANGILVHRWIREDYELSATDIKMGVTRESPLAHGTEETLAFLKDWKNNLRPGDIFATDGHTLLYVGNGYIIDCWGGKYSMETGRDTAEPNGALTFLHKLEDIFITGTDPELVNKYQVAKDGKTEWLVVIRPSNYLCKDDGDKDPGNDKVQDPFYALPAASATRLQYPGLEINRTADLHTFNSAVAGGEITYNIKLTNYSNQEDYLTWLHYDSANASYNGETFHDIPVTEVVPAGTQLVKAEGAEVSGSDLKWTVDLEPGASKTLSYTVKVTAPRGSLIVNREGYVGKIPSNTLETDVSGKKLTEADRQKLTAFAETPVTDWVKTYNIGDCTPSQFANKIYQDVLGIKLELPAEKEIYSKLCRQYHLKTLRGFGGDRKTRGYEAWPGGLRPEVDADFAAVKSMMVNGFVGGKGMHFIRPETCINEFRLNYLEPGDILFHTNLSGSINSNAPRKSKDYRVVVLLDATHVAILFKDGSYCVESGMWAEMALWEAFTYDFFCLLRPTKAYDDIHTLTYDRSGEAPVAAAKKTHADKPLGSKPLSEENQQKLAALTADGWDKEQRNLNFAAEVYKKIGIDIATDGLQGLSFANYLTNVCIKTTGTSDRNYLVPRTALDLGETYKAAYRMLLPGYYGGESMVTKDIDGIVKEYKISDFVIGDVIAMGSWQSSHYCVGVYQGDGKFLFSEFNATAQPVTTYDWYVETLDDAGLTAKLTDPMWKAFYALRPANGFKDINNIK